MPPPRNQALLMCGWEPALNETELDNFCMRQVGYVPANSIVWQATYESIHEYNGFYPYTTNMYVRMYMCA